MQIIINENNEITSYALIGSIKGGIEVNDYPKSFISEFEPKVFLYVNEQIIYNENYVSEIDIPIAPNDNDFLNAQLISNDIEHNAKIEALQQDIANLTTELLEMKGGMSDVSNT